MNFKNMFLSLIFIGSGLTLFANSAMPNDINPEELIELMLKDFSPEDREAILSEAKRIEDHLNLLSPGEREVAEQQMLEDANRLFQEVIEPKQAVEQKTQPTKQTKKAPKKSKEDIVQNKDINSIES